MRPAVVTLIVAFAINLMVFLIFNYIWNDAITVPMTNIANSTLGVGTTYHTMYTTFLGTLRNILGASAVLLLIAIILAYLLDSHRFEGEEFEYRY
jgi:hypothetical protein